MKGAMKRKIFTLTDTSGSNSSGVGVVVTHLRETFHITGPKSEKFQTVIIFVKNWPVRKMQQEFKASNYMSQTAKKSVKENFVKPKC
jgi:hypothetical protein